MVEKHSHQMDKAFASLLDPICSMDRALAAADEEHKAGRLPNWLAAARDTLNRLWPPRDSLRTPSKAQKKVEDDSDFSMKQRGYHAAMTDRDTVFGTRLVLWEKCETGRKIDHKFILTRSTEAGVVAVYEVREVEELR
jgi:hypothetical protein